jgi:Fe-S cluster assembly iron-binding protein IscA
LYDDSLSVPYPELILSIMSVLPQQLAKIASREPDNTKLALRLVVESGGCHGYQYKMDLDDDGAVVGD